MTGTTTGTGAGVPVVESTAPEPPSRRRATRIVAAVVAVAFLGLVVLLATREPVTGTVAGSPLLGRPAPEIKAETIGGETLRLAQLRGRFVLVNFFATWCPPCLREHDDLVRLSERHAELGDLQVVAVIFDDDPARVREFFAREGGDWPVLVDPKGQIALQFGVRGPPESYLVAPDGTVLTRIVGEVRDADIERILAEAARAGA